MDLRRESRKALDSMYCGTILMDISLLMLFLACTRNLISGSLLKPVTLKHPLTSIL